MAFPNYMNATEQRIVEQVINRGFEKGFSVSVWDGESWALEQSDDFELISAEVNATDMTQLEFRRGEEIIGSVILIHGNEEDVIHDHSDNPTLEDICRQ